MSKNNKEIVFYTNPESRACIVRRMLEEVGAKYTTKVLDYNGQMKTPEYLKINPLGKVPAITHGDLVVTETAAICAYLADQFPEKNLAPAPDSPERGTYYRWLFFGAGPVELATSAKACGWAIEGNEQMVGSGTLNEVMAALELAISKGPFICGEQFTAADVYIASHIGWGMQFKTLEERDSFKSYVERVDERPAIKKAAYWTRN
ncbi:glutathione S-transferase [Pseudidiomarina planktonica]|uniref:Glutathione S-transferase n=1 Tax=Pseudidiomarina planktonica TaxID=1323738 RepID=A0A1Y6EBJ1_9GAMM|nr:glutathione S-transferase family protein [Pseudidiomarina planktonica]RUO66361.1 glutathione S-transferase family protein [Pseudidiomarina planktonica]SMQ58561.1 glutathione S-transferase [Pseudidiomarina planktonica]